MENLSNLLQVCTASAPISAVRRLARANRIADIMVGLQITLQDDMHCRVDPWQRIPAGTTLECFGVQAAASKSDHYWIHLGDGTEGTDLNPGGEFVVFSFSELLEHSDLPRALTQQRRWPQAERSVDTFEA